ncbi:MAG: hypothetical protein ACKOJI_06960, partial [Phycisphaerales bacterium]
MEHLRTIGTPVLNTLFTARAGEEPRQEHAPRAACARAAEVRTHAEVLGHAEDRHTCSVGHRPVRADRPHPLAEPHLARTCGEERVQDGR